MHVHAPNLHTARVDALADEVTVAWLSSEIFFIKEAVILFPVRSDPSQGFSKTHLVSVFAVCSLGTTSNWFCSMKFSLNCFSFLTK
jgi:hypothetical protein